MKNAISLLIFLLLLFILSIPKLIVAQELSSYPGAHPEFNIDNIKPVIEGKFKFFTPQKESVDSFSTTVYTFANITVFSYFDNTNIKIYNSQNQLLVNKTLSADTLLNQSYGSGIFRIVGNKTFTVLVGDAITNYVNGYYAVDEAGKGVSTKLNTWMMNNFQPGQDDFIIFSYNNNTGFTVRNLVTGNIIRAGTLNQGERYSFRIAGDIPFQTPLQVVATRPVSVLSYTDQDYYVPSSNGTFAGTFFYGYSAYAGSWTNSITVTSYSNDNNVLVLNTETGDTIAQYTLGIGQVHSQPIFAPTFWTVQSTYPVTAANIPFAGWDGSYAYMTRAVDLSGSGAGTLFYVPTIQSRVDVFSFDNNNSITITKLGLYDVYPYPSPTVVYQGVLQAGEGYTFNSDWGKYVYKVEATNNVSVLQSNAGAGADFMPLSYALFLPDLAINNSDIKFSIPDSVYVSGDLIDVTVWVHNIGNESASNIFCMAYDGDPDAGGSAPPIASGTIPFIAVNDSAAFTFSFVVPNNPEFRSIVVKVDPNNQIVEANKSNNKAQRYLRPNNDLLPPLSISVTAPASLSLVNGNLSPNPFHVKYDIFNTGTVTALNVILTLQLNNGLTLHTGNLINNIGNIPANSAASVEFDIMANPDSSGFNLFTATVTATNAETKIINRAINIPDGIPPASPVNFAGFATGDSCASFTWNSNSEPDLAGYYLYYSMDSTNWNGTGSYQGNSPVIVYNRTDFVLCGLPVPDALGTFYWFKLKAFDTSTNLSDDSQVLKILVYANPVGIEVDDDFIPKEFVLYQNFPNPFNPSTKIKFSIPQTDSPILGGARGGFTTLKIYDIIGNEVITLVNEHKEPGIYEVEFSTGSSGDAFNLSSGVYFYTLRSGEFVSSKKMLLLK